MDPMYLEILNYILNYNSTTINQQFLDSLHTQVQTSKGSNLIETDFLIFKSRPLTLF